MTVEWREIGPQPAQIENGVDPAQQMIRWNAFLEIEFVEQPILSTKRWPHHPPISQPDDLGPRNHAATALSTEFFNSLGYTRPFEAAEGVRPLSRSKPTFRPNVGS